MRWDESVEKQSKMALTHRKGGVEFNPSVKYLWNGADKAWLPKNPAAASAQEHFRIKISVTANAVTDSDYTFI